MNTYTSVIPVCRKDRGEFKLPYMRPCLKRTVILISVDVHNINHRIRKVTILLMYSPQNIFKMCDKIAAMLLVNVFKNAICTSNIDTE